MRQITDEQIKGIEKDVMNLHSVNIGLVMNIISFLKTLPEIEDDKNTTNKKK